MAVDQPFGLLGLPGSPDLIVRFRLIVLHRERIFTERRS